MATAEQVKATTKEQKFECNICRKVFESLYILNYHKLLEHSESKRPPIRVGWDQPERACISLSLIFFYWAFRSYRRQVDRLFGNGYLLSKSSNHLATMIHTYIFEDTISNSYE